MFQMNLRTHIVHGGVLPRQPMAANITVRLPSLEELDNHAAQQWECFLLHLINSAEVEATTKSISPSMMKDLQLGLLSQKDREGSLLTKSGFLFLLMDTNAQLWYIIREYISNSEAYNMNSLDEVQRIIVIDLADLGLIKLQQIISFLPQNAHPRVAERVPSVPENVTDQIRLWESDLNRVEMTPAHFFDDLQWKAYANT